MTRTILYCFVCLHPGRTWNSLGKYSGRFFLFCVCVCVIHYLSCEVIVRLGDICEIVDYHRKKGTQMILTG